MIRCTIGALEPNEGIIFRVRSRLFTQTLVEVTNQYYTPTFFNVTISSIYFQKYGSSVQISSKLVARITQLPYMADPMSISYQVISLFPFCIQAPKYIKRNIFRPNKLQLKSSPAKWVKEVFPGGYGS